MRNQNRIYIKYIWKHYSLFKTQKKKSSKGFEQLYGNGNCHFFANGTFCEKSETRSENFLSNSYSLDFYCKLQAMFVHYIAIYISVEYLCFRSHRNLHSDEGVTVQENRYVR